MNRQSLSSIGYRSYAPSGTGIVVRTVIASPDLDTCLTALILGIGPGNEVSLAPAGATDTELADPQVLCIEAGGSGRLRDNNFDHHDPGQDLPPACVQAWYHNGCDPALERLVHYVALVDEAKPGASVAFPSLSNVFSGMRLLELDPLQRFITGLDLLNRVLARCLDPFASLPEDAAWQPYIAAKHDNHRRVKEALATALFFTTAGRLDACYCESQAAGGMGALYARGCDVVIMHNPAWGEPPVSKYTIAGKGRPVAVLLEKLDEHEPGWGGRATIIGSPRAGSRLKPDEVMSIVKKFL